MRIVSTMYVYVSVYVCMDVADDSECNSHSSGSRELPEIRQQLSFHVASLKKLPCLSLFFNYLEQSPER